MNKLIKRPTDYPLTVKLPEYMAMLGCGRATAEKIAREAGAKVKIGSTSLYNVPKTQAYLDKASNT